VSLFWNDLRQFEFLQYALIASLLASVACGVIGSMVVVRRATYSAGAIAHSVLCGMGVAQYLRRVHGVESATPLAGATVAAVLAALVIAALTRSGRQREDTVLSAVWAVGMAVGVSFIAMTPGYFQDLMSYLFGNILMVGVSDLWQMAALDAVILVAVFLFYEKFLVVGFQPELARLRGVKVDFYHTLLLVLVALTVVLLTQVVGLVMVIALLALPAATASMFAGRLWQIMILAGLLCMVFTVGGIALSYGPELPAGATVIELTGAGFFAAALGKWLWKRRVRKIHG